MTEGNPIAPAERAIIEIDPPGPALSERTGSEAPAVLIFDRGGQIVSATANVDAYLRDLGARDSRCRQGQELPLPVQVVLGALPREHTEQHRLPRLRIQTSSGRWLLLHAVWTAEAAGRPSERVVIIGPAPDDAAWFVGIAYGLDSWKEELVRLLARGVSTMTGGRLRLALV